MTEPSLTLQEALAQQVVEVEVSGAGGHTGESLRLKIRSLHRRALEVRIPAGQLFHSRDSTLQDLIVIDGKALLLEQGKTRLLRLRGMCTQASHGSPGEGSRFVPGEEAGGKLGKLVSYIDQQHLIDMSAQYAIWAVTDGKSLGNIEHEGLRRFTAELLGQTPPPYVVLRGRTLATPGAPAFSEPPLAVKGVFTYQTDKDIQASFGLYNEAGELLHTFFADQLQRKGSHRFTFFFEIRNLPAGTYYARLNHGDQVIEDLEVVW